MKITMQTALYFQQGQSIAFLLCMLFALIFSACTVQDNVDAISWSSTNSTTPILQYGHQTIAETESMTRMTKNSNNKQIVLYNGTTTNIVGGTEVTEAKNSYKFYGFTRVGNLCGATLIHTDIAITAGHCAGYFLRFGMYMGGVFFNGSDARENLTVSNEVRHPKFNATTFENDILILKLNRTNSSSIRPITSLNFSGRLPLDNSTVVTIGFGRTIEGGPTSDTLKQVSISVVNNALCQQLYQKDNSLVTNSMICAARRGKDACQGDSGGPLLMQITNRMNVKSWKMVGIVSWGIGCARPNNPGVYTRLSNYSSFIKTNVCTLSQYKPSYCSSL